MLTDSSEIKASQAFRETPLQPRRSSSDMQDRRRRYFRHVSVSLLQPGKETGTETHQLSQLKRIQSVCVCVFLRIIFMSPILAIPINLSPPRLSSESVFRVDEPTAVSRLMEWSVRPLQWERSSFVKWGIWRITRRRVESLMSRPASRKHCIVRN